MSRIYEGFSGLNSKNTTSLGFKGAKKKKCGHFTKEDIRIENKQRKDI